MSDLRVSNAPKERSRAGRSRENAPNLAGVNSVLALDTKILMAVSSWAKHVHEKLIPGSFPAHADVPVLNNAEFELLIGDAEYFDEVVLQCMSFVDSGSANDFAVVRALLNTARLAALQRDATRRAAFVQPQPPAEGAPVQDARAARYAARVARQQQDVGGEPVGPPILTEAQAATVRGPDAQENDAALASAILNYEGSMPLLHPRLLQLVATSTDYRNYMARLFGVSEERMEAWRRFQASLLGALFSLCATHIDLQSTPHEKDWTAIELLDKVRSVFSQSGDETVQLSTFDKFLSLQLTGRPLRRYIEELAKTRREHKSASSFAPDISNDLFLMIVLIRMYTDRGGVKVTRSDSSVYCASRYDMFFRGDAKCCQKLFDKLNNNDFKGALLLLTRFAESIADERGLSRGLVRQQTQKAAVAASTMEQDEAYYAYNSPPPSRPRGAKKKSPSGARRLFKMLCGNCGKSDCSAYRCTEPCQACGGDDADHKSKDCPILSQGKGSYIKWHAACIKRGVTPHGRAPRVSREGRSALRSFFD